MDSKSFLLEIGCEEIPVTYVEPALKQLAGDIAAWLAGERLAHGEIERFATPRRLALLVRDLDLGQEDFEEEVTGPPKAAAFRDGEPTKAALGFARGQGVALEDVYFVETPKGEYLAAHRKTPGRKTTEILAEGLAARIQALRFPKTMTWGDGSLRFARPIRWIVALLGEDVIDFTLGTLRSSAESRGHRLLSPEAFAIPSAEGYETALATAEVTANSLERRAKVLDLAREAARSMGGALVEDAELLDTVNYLVEKPAALAGRFDERFLELPREVISTAMKSHQRYFSVENNKGDLLPGFIVILNGERSRPDVVRSGNERVLQARLADARFYWEEDRKLGLAGMMERLKSVIWLDEHGSIARRAERLEVLSDSTVGMPGFDLDTDKDALKEAAKYCKADLASEMVKDGKEFTKLQGYMGQEYALVEGWTPEKSAIIYEHYFPRFAGDRLPRGAEALALALADRMDAIVGFWLAGFAPTGSKDPYALRRQALAVLRILIEENLALDLTELLTETLKGYPQASEGVRGELRDFFHGRLKVMLAGEGVAPDVFDAVLATGGTKILDLKARAMALNDLRGDAAFEKLVIGARRVGNILAKEDWTPSPGQAGELLEAWALGRDLAVPVDETLMKETVERELFAALRETAPELAREAEARDFAGAYRRLADLGAAIDVYFDGVMVNAEEPALRTNRLAFLKNLAQVFLYLADFSRVVLEGEREG